MNKQLILHLSLIKDVGPGTIASIINRKDSGATAPDFYSFSSQDWMSLYGLSQRMAEKITTGLRDTKILENELCSIEKHNVKWVAITDDSYPELLREIHTPPSILYWQGGDFTCKKSIAVVGSRKITAYGQRVISTLIPDLVTHGWTITSGGALGVDTVAHQKALAAHGKTIVVLGSGLLYPYPTINRTLFRLIIESGGIVASPFSMTMQPLPGNFPARNRIISGLSHGCLVVQAAQKSGALITAHYALEQGREVFAVPGSIDDEFSVGCHSLIQNGAKLVATTADILSEFDGYVALQKDKQEGRLENIGSHYIQQQRIPVIDPNVTEVHYKIIAACKTPASCDDIVQCTGLSLSDVQVELFDLQIAGKITQDFSGMWIATGL